MVPLVLSQQTMDIIDEVSSKDHVIGSFVFGSSANGYSKKDSDIDLGIITKENFDLHKAVKAGQNIEIHYIDEAYTKALPFMPPYMSMSVIPIRNPNLIERISLDTKKYIVRKQVKRVARKIETRPLEIEILFPIRNFLYAYNTERPWRMVPFERILKSPQTWDILEKPYKHAFDELVEDRILYTENEKYFLNPGFIFTDLEKDLPRKFLWKLGKSSFGYHYIKNARKIAEYKNQII